MHFIKNTIVIIGLAAVAGSALAQEEEAATSFTYATYFYCDAAGQERVDEIVKTQNAPVYDQMVKDGVITGWGWLAHHTGGKWRRIQYYQAPTVDGLLDAQAEIDKRFTALGDTGDAEFGKICRSHDDYIWEAKSGSSGEGRGEAGFSVYYGCDQSREMRADEIVAKDFAPLFDKYVAAGKFTSWGWSSHSVGGEFRRLQTMTAKDHKSLLKARNEMIDEMYAEGSKAGEEFASICGSHVDYMWDIQLETP
ncbi:MAG: hypothetical protein HKN57_07275 [Xanthomonadales bacterium]|nr:hypothetical protein [Gammaproteobacteria bacterium]NND57036.1 hypothetical protein [Xanthomonadales bacterium]